MGFRNPTTDLIIVLVVVLLIFGPKRLPGLGKQLGQGMREFKESITGESKNDSEEKRPELTQASGNPVPQAGPVPEPAGREASAGSDAGTGHQSAEVSSEPRA